MSRPSLRSRVGGILDRLGLKEAVKPPLIEFLDLLKVRHGLSRDPRILVDLKRLSRGVPAPGHGPEVLMTSFRGAWLLHGSIEALIAEALRRRGARPTVFVCSGDLPNTLPGRAPACGIANYHDTRVFSCPNCLRCGTAVANALELPVLRLTDVSVERRADPDELAGLDMDALKALRHRDLPVGEFALAATRWFLCVSDAGAVPEGEAVLRSFVQSGLLFADAVPGLLDRTRPEVVVVLNGLFLFERILRAEALRRGIRVVTYEHGQMPDTVCFSRDIANHYELGPLWQDLQHQPLGPAEATVLDHYLEERRKGVPGITSWPMSMKAEDEIRRRLSLDPSRSLAVLFTNVTWDSAAQDRDRGFANMYAWVAETIRLFGGLPEAQLVVRIHPGEVGLAGWVTRDPVLARLQRDFAALPENVRVVPPEDDLSSYGLIRMARCGLVYTSTVGLEMAMEGYPVVVAGDVHYAAKGFTLDTGGPEDYPQTVRRALAASRDPAVSERARRYGHAFFFRYFHPFRLVSENYPDLVPSLNVHDPHVLDPGGDPTLDLVCRAILEGGDFYASSSPPPAEGR